MRIWHVVTALAMLASGCAHEVTFDRPEHYAVAGPHEEAALTCVIDPQTLAMKVPINSFMTGAAHEWNVEPGDMLKQVAAIELPQMFSHYDFATSSPAHAAQGRNVVLELSIPSYRFEDFHAKVAVAAKAYDGNHKRFLDKTYTAEGETQGAKMFWGGAFAMKSAIRQSSLEAYKKIFEQLRADLAAIVGHS